MPTDCLWDAFWKTLFRSPGCAQNRTNAPVPLGHVLARSARLNFGKFEAVSALRAATLLQSHRRIKKGGQLHYGFYYQLRDLERRDFRRHLVGRITEPFGSVETVGHE